MISFRKSSSGIDGFLGDGTPIPKEDVERALSSGEPIYIMCKEQCSGATTTTLTDGRIIQLGKEGLRLIVIKASQKATGRRLDRGKQSLDGVLRDRLAWITDGQVADEDRLKQLVGKFNASRRDGDPKVGRAL